ncbi:hypothetical protein ABW20_dc0107570 [Dactylellina cionopaga]|nr:hypothetical protein ABW20_dc0107570 [Dactylellina cionopaga]
MVQFSEFSSFGLTPILFLLRLPCVSAIIINVVASNVAEVWRENDEDALRRPKRLCPERPELDDDYKGDYAAAIDAIKAEYPSAELRIASLGTEEIVGVTIPVSPTRLEKFAAKIGQTKNAITGFISGGKYGSHRGSPVGIDLVREFGGGDGNRGDILPEDILGGGTWREDITGEDAKSKAVERANAVNLGMPSIKNQPQERFEESKESDKQASKIKEEDDRISLVEVKLAQSGNQGENVDQSVRDTDTIYETAWGGDEDDRLGDIYDWDKAYTSKQSKNEQL